MEIHTKQFNTDDPHFVAARELMRLTGEVLTPPPGATEQQIVGNIIAAGADAMLQLAAIDGAPPQAGLSALASLIAIFCMRQPDPDRALVLIEYNAETRLAAILATAGAPAGSS